jgi:hypothetical protein
MPTSPILHILVDFENTQPGAADVALVTGAQQRLWIFRGPSQKKYDAEFTEALLQLGELVRVIKCEKSGRNALDMHIAFQLGRLVGELHDGEAAGAARPAFAVVSRDTDYEPLLQYLRVQGFTAQRVISIKAALGGAAVRPATKAAAKPATARPARTPAPSVAAKAKPTAAPAARGEKSSALTKAPAGRAAKAPAAAKAKASTSGKSAASDAGAAMPALAKVVAEHFRDHPKSRPAKRGGLEKWLESHFRGKLGEGGGAALVAELERQGVVRLDGKKVAY